MIAAKALTVADNDEVRVTRWSFSAVGAGTGMHHHDVDYVVVPVTGGRFEVTDSDRVSQEMLQVAGESYLRSAGATHDVVSVTADEVVFVEIELKP